MTERVCEEKEKRPRLLYNARCLDKLDVGLDPDAIATVVCVCVCVCVKRERGVLWRERACNEGCARGSTK